MEQDKLIEKYVNKRIEENAGIVVVLVLVFLLVFGIIRSRFGNYKIGHWFEKRGAYTTQYWVYLEPDSKSTKNYRVKGDIRKELLGSEEGWGYYLETVYWNNGGTSYFDCELESAESISGTYCGNDEGKWYVVRLGENIKE